MRKFKKLERLLLIGLLGVVITREAFSAEQLFSRTYPRFMARMPLRLFSSVAPTSIDLTAEWNKGFVPSVKKVSSQLSHGFSGKDLVEPIEDPFQPPILSEEIVRHGVIASRKWFFDPRRSLPYYRDYYSEEEIRQHKDQNVRLKEPVSQDDDTVKFSLEKSPKKKAGAIEEEPTARDNDAVEFSLKKKKK